MDFDQFSHRIEGMRRRVSVLYQGGEGAERRADLLERAYEELQIAMEELQAAEEMLREQNLRLLEAQDDISQQLQRYQDLFDRAPIAYLVTGFDGTIRLANQAAARLFGSQPKSLVGRALTLFAPEGERRAFRAKLASVRERGSQHHFEQRFTPWHGDPFNAELIVGVEMSPTNRPTALRWMILNSGERKRAQQHVGDILSKHEKPGTGLYSSPSDDGCNQGTSA